MDHASPYDVLSLGWRLVVLRHVWQRNVHVRWEAHFPCSSAWQHLDCVLSLSLQGSTLLPSKLDFLESIHSLLGFRPQRSGVPDWSVTLPLDHECRIVRQDLSLRVSESHCVLNPAWVTLHLERLVALRTAKSKAGSVITHKHFALSGVYRSLAEWTDLDEAPRHLFTWREWVIYRVTNCGKNVMKDYAYIQHFCWTA